MRHAKWSVFPLIVASVAIASLSSPGAAITLGTFTDPYASLPGLAPGGTIGFAYAGDMFVGSVYNSGNNVLYSCDLSGGNLQMFAPSVTVGGSNPEEHFVTSSLGLGGFASRNVFVASSVGNSILQIDHAGTTGSTFATGFSGAPRGILFDAIGTFGFNMIVTTTSGDVYKVDSAGNKTLLASVGEDTEGLDIAPIGAGFGAFDGNLLVASENSGLIRAISPTGVVTPITSIGSAEELSFVPMNLGQSGNPVEGFYGSNFPVDVLKADASQFLGMQGDMVVTSETGHTVNRVHWNGSGFDVTNIGSFPNQPEDGIFVTSAIIQPVPEPASVGLLGLGLGGLGLATWRKRRKSA